MPRARHRPAESIVDTSTSPSGPYVVVAPDKFKGSLSSVDAAAALARGLRRRLPRARVVEHPVADGGDGTVEVAVRSGFDPTAIDVSGPLGHAVTAVYASRGRTAVIETASAAGLALLPGCAPDDATAGTASTFGIGQLIGASGRTALLSTIAVNAALVAGTHRAALVDQTGTRSAIAAFSLLERGAGGYSVEGNRPFRPSDDRM